MIDPTVNLGTILHAVAMIVALLGAFYRLDRKVHALHAEISARVALVESKVNDLWEEWKEQRRQGGRT